MQANYITSNNGGYTATNAGPSRELQMPMSFADLERSIERLMKVSDELSLRLDKVCQPEPPRVMDNSVKDAVPGMPQAEFVQALFGNSARVRIVCERLENLLSRLEL